MAYLRNEKNYWKMALIPIIAYTLYMGLRFGRLIDYNLYAVRYYDIGSNIKNSTYEPIFTGVVYAFNLLGIPYQGFILFCSCIFICSAMVYYKEFRIAMPFILVCFIQEAVTAENFIRWFFGVCFVMIFLRELHAENYIKALVMVVLATMSHVGLLPVCVGIVAVALIRKVPPPWLILGLLVISLFFGTSTILASLGQYLSVFAVDERSDWYISQFSDIANGLVGGLGMRESYRLTTIIRNLLSYGVPIFVGARLYTEKRIKRWELNCFYVGIIAKPILTSVEIFNRFGIGFNMVTAAVCGYSYWYVFKNRRYFKKEIVLLACLGLFAYIEPFFSDMLSRTTYYMLFYWDAHGREYLPLYLLR